MPVIGIVTGGRSYSNKKVVRAGIQASQATFILEGGATGADTLARQVCDELGIPHITVWALWKRFNKAAGHKRNKLMLDIAMALNEDTPIVGIVFPGGTGTANMRGLIEQAGYPWYECYEGDGAIHAELTLP